MKRMHIHLSVNDIEQNIKFYSAMFDALPTVKQSDYAKWIIEDPAVNFAISNRCHESGLNHLGFELDSSEELDNANKIINENNLESFEEKGAHCCYAESDKYWVFDPQGIPWENFHTLKGIPIYRANLGKDKDNSFDCCLGTNDTVKSISGCC
jgi:catechol 2,3-dioxygenase-like lactoylglutathione lyase family enzyme